MWKCKQLDCISFAIFYDCFVGVVVRRLESFYTQLAAVELLHQPKQTIHEVICKGNVKHSTIAVQPNEQRKERKERIMRILFISKFQLKSSENKFSFRRESFELFSMLQIAEVESVALASEVQV